MDLFFPIQKFLSCHGLYGKFSSKTHLPTLGLAKHQVQQGSTSPRFLFLFVLTSKSFSVIYLDYGGLQRNYQISFESWSQINSSG